jgi:hypothetical protein
MSTPRIIKKLSYARAKELLDYNSLTGELRWRVDRLSGRNKVQVRAGSIAGHCHFDGYIRVKLDGVVYRAQHIIWLLQTGHYPSLEIDHRNGDDVDNRWINLRLATTQENGRNRRVHKSNTSGAKGVDFHNGKWRARIIVGYKQLHLGSFSNFDDAVKARLGAERQHFGDFVRAATMPWATKAATTPK